MKWVLIALGVVGLLFAVGGVGTCTIYNGLVSADNEAERTWANVQTAYQQRLDTLPKFAEVARVSTKFQIELQKQYVSARNNVNVVAANGDAPQLQQAADQEFAVLFESFRNFLNINVEATPEAKTDQLTELNSQIESVERMIKHERDAYNKAVKDRKDKMKTFPGNKVAGEFGFEPDKYKPFQASEAAQTSPDLDLDPDFNK
ncbi:MAG: LemA family protein [Candidatus Spechtbacterales bacterium]